MSSFGTRGSTRRRAEVGRGLVWLGSCIQGAQFVPVHWVSGYRGHARFANDFSLEWDGVVLLRTVCVCLSACGVLPTHLFLH